MWIIMCYKSLVNYFKRFGILEEKSHRKTIIYKSRLRSRVSTGIITLQLYFIKHLMREL